jgi:uncharacterized membrane protein
MNQVEPLSLLLMLAALFASVANLLIAQSRNKIKKSEVDAQALEMAVKLATATPGLEQQLRDTLAQLHLARVQLAEQTHQLDEQAERIADLENERDTLIAELTDARHTDARSSIHP